MSATAIKNSARLIRPLGSAKYIDAVLISGKYPQIPQRTGRPDSRPDHAGRLAGRVIKRAEVSGGTGL
ncbi:hypothetical protein GCM10010317_070530 [Streptomyces mirabilis]|nr:hypothetical protein GCM10010317_070530 [Streptomyces mirabilis]